MEREGDLIRWVVDGISAANWTVGRSAALWLERQGRGCDDRDFGILIGLRADEVRLCRRVYETFWSVRDVYPNLRWMHFAAALDWGDATDCLAWANEWDATVAEMRAWRRAQRGEDLTIDEGNPNG